MIDVPWKHSELRVASRCLTIGPGRLPPVDKGIVFFQRPGFLDAVLIKSRILVLTPAQMHPRFRLVVVYQVSQDLQTVQLLCKRLNPDKITHGDIFYGMTLADYSHLVEPADYTTCVEPLVGCTDVYAVVRIPPPTITCGTGRRSLPMIDESADGFNLKELFMAAMGTRSPGLNTWQFFHVVGHIGRDFNLIPGMMSRYVCTSGLPEAFLIRRTGSSMRYKIDICVDIKLTFASLIGETLRVAEFEPGNGGEVVMRILPSDECSSSPHEGGPIECDEESCGYVLFGLKAAETVGCSCSVHLRPSRHADVHEDFGDMRDWDDGARGLCAEWFAKWTAEHVREETREESSPSKRPRPAGGNRLSSDLYL